MLGGEGLMKLEEIDRSTEEQRRRKTSHFREREMKGDLKPNQFEIYAIEAKLRGGEKTYLCKEDDGLEQSDKQHTTSR